MLKKCTKPQISFNFVALTQRQRENIITRVMGIADIVLVTKRTKRQTDYECNSFRGKSATAYVGFIVKGALVLCTSNALTETRLTASSHC
jgi:hypothetical protein